MNVTNNALIIFLCKSPKVSIKRNKILEITAMGLGLLFILLSASNLHLDNIVILVWTVSSLDPEASESSVVQDSFTLTPEIFTCEC